MLPLSSKISSEKAVRVGELLRDVPILRALNVQERIKLATLMDHVIYEANQMVFKLQQRFVIPGLLRCLCVIKEQPSKFWEKRLNSSQKLTSIRA